MIEITRQNQKVIYDKVSYALRYILKPTDTVLCIASNTSLQKLVGLPKGTTFNALQQKWGAYLPGIITITMYSSEFESVRTDFDKILIRIRNLSNIVRPTVILAIGGGTVIDYAKLYGKTYNLPVIAVPSMLSTNVFATDKVAAFYNGKKKTVVGKLPEYIIVDEGYLNKSKQENLYGIVDVLSITTALKDWKLAHSYDNLPITEIYDSAEQLLSEVLSNEDIGNANIKWIFDRVLEAGYITNDYGSGRPESGSEHIFASALEGKIKIPHALAVAIGIEIMSYCQGQLINLPFKDLGVFEGILEYNITYNLVWETFKSLQPRPDKFTVVNLPKQLDIGKDELELYLSNKSFVFKEV